MKFLLAFAQPRQASFDKKIPIFERRELPFDAENETAARRIARAILKKGAVRCGEKTCRRQKIALGKIPGLAPLPMPKPEFLPLDECV